MNVRKCNRCSEEILAVKLVGVDVARAAHVAWLHGFCGNYCMTEHAAETVEAGKAWWQIAAKEKPRCNFTERGSDGIERSCYHEPHPEGTAHSFWQPCETPGCSWGRFHDHPGHSFDLKREPFTKVGDVIKALVVFMLISFGAAACSGRPLDVPEPMQVDAGADLTPAPQGYVVSVDMAPGIAQPHEPAYIDADLAPACTNCGQDAGQ